MEASWAKVMEVSVRLRAARMAAIMKDADEIRRIYPKNSGLNPHDDTQVAADIFLQLTDIDFDAYIMTASGYKVRLYRCTPDDIRTDDVVSGLCNESRFCGQTPRPLPVACHLLNGLDIAKERGVALRWLLHDVEEAYLGDLPSPIKKAGINLPYMLAAAHIQEQAGKRYALNADEKEEAIVKEIDEAMLELEQQWRRGNGSLKYDRWSEELAFGLKCALNVADSERYF